MGTTITSLHLYGMERKDLVPFLAEDDVLRDVNPPWLSIIPSSDGDRHDPSRMERLAKKLSKQHEDAYALLFFYIDEDAFACKLFKAGKRVAECQSNQSWAKLGKALNLLFGDEAPAKSLRYASHCFSLDEQVQLLEETLGVALLDFPEEEGRTVPRSDALVRAIKAREAALRKRPNQCTLTEVPFEEWPEPFQAKQCLYAILRPDWRQVSVSELLCEIASWRYVVPYREHIAAYPDYDIPGHNSTVYFFNKRSGLPSKLFLPRVHVLTGGALWATRAGAPVFLVTRFLRTRVKDTRFGPVEVDENSQPYLACFDADGKEIWKFCAETEQEYLHAVHTAADGTITLYSPCQSLHHEDGTEYIDGRIYQVDGETGALLRSVRIPAAEDMHILFRVDAIDGFIYHSQEKQEVVVLDAAFHETARWHKAHGILNFEIKGSLIWDQSFSHRELEILDLRTGCARTVRLELPLFVRGVLPDGKILATNDAGNQLTVFDQDGKVISRHTVPGSLAEVFPENGRVLLSEWRSTEDTTYYCEKSLNASSMHVWQLEDV